MILIILTLLVSYKFFKNIYIKKAEETNKFMVVDSISNIFIFLVLVIISIFDFTYMLDFVSGNNSVIIKYLLFAHSIFFAALLLIKNYRTERQ